MNDIGFMESLVLQLGLYSQTRTKPMGTNPHPSTGIFEHRAPDSGLEIIPSPPGRYPNTPYA